MDTVLLLIFLGTAAVFIALGFPLMKNKVPPNGLYGFRTNATLTDPAVWYPVNRTSGAWIVVGGVVVAISAVATYLAGLSDASATLINTAVMLASLLWSAIQGLRLQHRLTTPGPKQ